LMEMRDVVHRLTDSAGAATSTATRALESAKQTNEALERQGAELRSTLESYQGTVESYRLDAVDETANEDQEARVDALTERLLETEKALNRFGELFPSSVQWRVKKIDNVRDYSVGRAIKCPPFVLCGFLAGIKMEFYPRGRYGMGNEDNSSLNGNLLPDITPRPSAQKALKACAVAVCGPQGARVHYHLRMGGWLFENCQAEYNWMYHDVECLPTSEDEDVIITLRVTKLLRRGKVKGEEVQITSEL